MTAETPPPIRARGVSVRYGAKYGVREVDVDLSAGEILGIIGPNGAGKTSLVECIEGLRKRSGGEVTVFGRDPERSRVELAKRVGVQLQDSSFPTRARLSELCRLFSSFYDDPWPVDELLDRFELSGERKSYVSDLSGGERQRLALVLALLGRPELLLLDELTTGLDPAGRRSTWGLLRTLNDSGISLVLTSHSMDEIEELCDQVILLTHGSVRARGSVRDLIEMCADSHCFVLDEELATLVALDALTEITGIASATRQGRRVVVRGTPGEGYRRLREVVAAQGGDPDRIRHRPPNMEDAFLSLTGQAPEGTSGVS